MRLDTVRVALTDESDPPAHSRPSLAAGLHYHHDTSIVDQGLV